METIDLRFEPGKPIPRIYAYPTRTAPNNFWFGNERRPSVFTPIRSHTSMNTFRTIMLRTRRPVLRVDQFTSTNVERRVYNVQEQSVHACRHAEFRSKTLQDGDHAIAQLQLGICKLMSTGGYDSLLLINAIRYRAGPHGPIYQRIPARYPTRPKEAHADLHSSLRHPTVAQSGYVE